MTVHRLETVKPVYKQIKDLYQRIDAFVKSDITKIPKVINNAIVVIHLVGVVLMEIIILVFHVLKIPEEYISPIQTTFANVLKVILKINISIFNVPEE